MSNTITKITINQLPILNYNSLTADTQFLINPPVNDSGNISLTNLIDWINSNWSNVENIPVVLNAANAATQGLTVGGVPAGFTDAYLTYDLLLDSLNALGLVLSVTQQNTLLNHLQNINNPHQLTANTIGLGLVQNLTATTTSTLSVSTTAVSAFINDYNNGIIDDGLLPEQYVTFDFLASLNNLLGLSGLMGLGQVQNYPPTSLQDINTLNFNNSYITYALLEQAALSTGVLTLDNTFTQTQITSLTSHLSNYNNPHQVTTAQLNLANVANYPAINATSMPVPDTKAYITLPVLSACIQNVIWNN